MKAIALSIFIATAALLGMPSSSLACRGATMQEAAKDGVECQAQACADRHGQQQATTWQGMSAQQLASAIERATTDPTAKIAVFDATSEEARSTVGIIPGALRLSSPDDYDVADELPVDKTTMLVFYCANSGCTASRQAAQRAHKAGYRNVFVLNDGIVGWLEAGLAVSS